MSLRLAVLALASLAPPDILPPGAKGVRHELVLRADPATAGWRFIASPTHGFGIAAVTPGEPFRFSTKYGTRLWALPPDAPMPTRHDLLESHPSAELPLELGSTAITNHLARIVTTLELLAIEGTEIRLRVVGEERFDAAGRRLHGGWLFTVILLLLAAGGLAGTAWLWRRP
jgi:hypothetical protein